MALVAEENVPRKRKKTLEVTNIKSNKNRYNVLEEHNYFRKIKTCWWSVKDYSYEDSSPNSTEKKSIINCDDNDKCHSDNELHDFWKKEQTLSSNESSCDEVDDYKEKSLAQLLQMEYAKDLKKEDLNNRWSNYFLLLNKNELCPVSIEAANDHDLSSGLLELKPELMNCCYPLNVSKDSKYYTPNIEKSIKLNTTKVKDEVFENLNIINDAKEVKLLKKFRKRPKIFQPFMNWPQLKSKVVENVTTFESFSNTALIKKSRKDECKDILLNDSFNSTNSTNHSDDSSCKEEICCMSAVNTIDQDLFNDTVPESPKNVCPPLDWILLIYLTIKNSSGEYVTCYDIQTFSRNWFNYYADKTCVNDIYSALSRYSEEYFHSISITVDSGNMWTVKNESVNALETILKTITYRYEDEIKSAMKHPDHLHILLNGYGVFNLGYKHKENIKKKY